MKAQIWFTDFVIAILIFSFILISYYAYTTNISKQDTSAMDQLVTDIKTVSTSLTTEGFPSNWDANTVTRIGFTDNSNRIDNTKFDEFNKINYNKTKKLLGTIYDYFLFFVNESGDVQNIEGYCGTGLAEVNITLDVSAAYYYSDEGEKFLLDFMESKFNAQIYKKGEAGIDLSDLIDDMNNDKYGLVVMEHANLEGVDYNNYQDDIENYVSDGGFLMFSGQLLKPNDQPILGIIFHKESGVASTDQNATVFIEDELLTFEVDTNITFDQAYYVINDAINSENFIRIARFVNPDITDPDENNAIARWIYGGGKALFFSDFNAEYFAGDFQANLEASTKKWAGAGCLSINISNIQRDNLVKVERLLIYNSNQVKMVLYLWQ